MEEAEDVLGLGLSPGFKFQPDDDELVEYFLLRRILGQQLPLEGIILEDDPLSAPPWELLDKHKRKADGAFFFTNGQPIDDKGNRQKRTCIGGGCWQGQKPIVDGDRLRVADSGMEITWKKYMLNFRPDGETGSMGWVMHEYSITAPVDLASSSLMRLYSIRFSGHGQNAKREPDEYAQAKAERHLLEAHSSAANSVDFPTAAAVDLVDDDQGGSERPAAPSYSDQDYQNHWVNATPDWPQLESYQDALLAPDSFFLPGADVGDYAGAGPGGAPSHQDFVGGNTMNLGARSATASSDQEDPGVMHAAAPAGMLAPFMDQGSFSGGAIDELFMDFELLKDINLDELLDFSECGLEAPLHDQYSSAGMETQSYMQLS